MKQILLIFLALFLQVVNADEDSHHSHSQGQHELLQAQPQIWTCSMHPQIKLSQAGKCPICGMDLVQITPEENNAERSTDFRTSALIRFEVTPVTRQLIETEVRLTGVLEVDETRLTHLTAWVPGRIERLFIDYTGVSVVSGDHMFEIYSPDLISAQEELIQARIARNNLSKSNSVRMKTSAARSLEAARDKLRLLGLSSAQVDQIEQRGTPKDTLTIYAPSGGVVTNKNVTEGMYVETGTRVYSIADLSSLWLFLDAYESDLPWLGYHQEVIFTTQSLPGREFWGRVSFVSPFVNPLTRTVRIRVNVPNDVGLLKPGMFVKGVVKSTVYKAGKTVHSALKGMYIGPMHPEIISDVPGKCPICGMKLKTAESLGYKTDSSMVEKPLVIPVTAPLITGKRAVVYVQDPENSQFSLREVTLGPKSSDYYIVEEGLEEGELVVTHGAFRLDADQQIRGKPSMMSPHGGSHEGGHTGHSM